MEKPEQKMTTQPSGEAPRDTEEKLSAIPPQYKGMPSEIVEELWQNPTYIDEGKNKAETKRRQVALEEIKKMEQEREARKEEAITQQFAHLSAEEKTFFPDAQKDAVVILHEYIQGKRDMEGLSSEESFVIEKLRTSYETFKKEHPDRIFSIDFAKDIDRRVYINCAQRLAFNVLKAKRNISDQEKANTLRKSLGIPTQGSETFDREGDQSVQEVTPVDIIAINDNTGIERRKIDAKNVEFQQNSDGTVTILYAGKKWYVKEGQLVEQVVGNKVVRVIIHNDRSAAHASYEPLTDVYTIGPKAREEYEKDPEMFLSSIDHEVAHSAYFSLDEKQQKGINDIFLHDTALQDSLRRFATALYTDRLKMGAETAGENYLTTHGTSNDVIRQTTLTPEGQKGLKDARSIVFEIDGKRNEVFVGLLITELISYMSSLEIGQDVFSKVSEKGKNARGGEDPRYDVVKACHDHIVNNSKIYSDLKKYKLLGRETEIEKLFVNLVKS